MLLRSRPLALLICVAALARVTAARADMGTDGPPYRVMLQSDAALDVVGEPGATNGLSLDTLSGMGRKILVEDNARPVVACGYDGGVRITTKNPTFAAEDILRQISEATGLKLRYSIDGRMAAIKPVVMVQGFSDTAVVTVLLTPTQSDQFLVSCAYVIDSRPPGSIDGTRANAEKMRAEARESHRMMDEDSIADTLPTSIADADVQRPEIARRYFRGIAKMPVERDGKFTAALLVMLKRTDTYTIGFYELRGREWMPLDAPVVLTGTKAPYMTNLPNQNRGALRADLLSGHGRIYVHVENGHVVRQEL